MISKDQLNSMISQSNLKASLNFGNGVTGDNKIQVRVRYIYGTGTWHPQGDNLGISSVFIDNTEAKIRYMTYNVHSRETIFRIFSWIQKLNIS